jgi:hypothetical protein
MDRKMEYPLFPLVSGTKEFTDYYTFTIENGYEVSVVCTDTENAPASSPNINLSNLPTNKETCTSSDNINWNNEMFSIAAGDKVRIVVESKDVM